MKQSSEAWAHQRTNKPWQILVFNTERLQLKGSHLSCMNVKFLLFFFFLIIKWVFLKLHFLLGNKECHQYEVTPCGFCSHDDAYLLLLNPPPPDFPAVSPESNVSSLPVPRASDLSPAPSALDLPPRQIKTFAQKLKPSPPSPLFSHRSIPACPCTAGLGMCR